jgi:hypothetical protein
VLETILGPGRVNAFQAALLGAEMSRALGLGASKSYQENLAEFIISIK